MPLIRKVYRQGNSWVVSIPEWMLELMHVVRDGEAVCRLVLEVKGGGKLEVWRYVPKETT